MELTQSFERVFPSLLTRFEFVEVRNAAATLCGTCPTECAHIQKTLTEFSLSLQSLTNPGGNKGDIAKSLDLAFRKLGWREAGHRSKTTLTFRIEPFKAAGEKEARERKIESSSQGHKVDNFRGSTALDVEWNAKDGNLDRDLSNFRVLHEAALIDAGVIITRHHESTKWAANWLAEKSKQVRYDKKGRRIILLGTTTTTNLEKLIPRLERGDGGGCPVLAIAITDRCYAAKTGDPKLPPFNKTRIQHWKRSTIE